MKSIYYFCLNLSLVFCSGLGHAYANPKPEPTMGPTFCRMVYDCGARYGQPKEKLLMSYQQMAEMGFDGVCSYVPINDEKVLMRTAGYLGMTPQEYRDAIIQHMVDAKLDFWLVFSLQSLLGTNWISNGAVVHAVDVACAIAKRYKDVSCFRGLCYDEPNAPDDYAPATLAQFKERLLQKYTPRQLEEMGLWALTNKDVKIVAPLKGMTDHHALSNAINLSEKMEIILPANYKENPILFMEYEEFIAEKWTLFFREIETAIQAIRSDLITIPILSFNKILHAPFRASVARLGCVCGAISVDPYWDGVPEEAFWAKLMRNQARGPSFLTIAAGNYSSGPERFARDLALCLAHSPALLVWQWPYAWKEAPDYSPPNFSMQWHGYRPGNYAVLTNILARTDKCRRYLAPSFSIAPVAFVYSERESLWEQAGPEAWPRQNSFIANCYGLHSIFAQLAVQYEPVFEELITDEALKPFRVLLLPGISYLSPNSMAMLTKWVEEGGNLLVLGKVGDKDYWGRLLPNSIIENLLGVTEFSALTGMAFSCAFPRQVEMQVRYDSTLPAWTFQPVTAQVLGYWDGGRPAVACNSIGKGQVITIGAERLGCCYVGWGGRRIAIYKDFFPGVTNFFGMAITSTLNKQKDMLVLQEVQHPRYVEVTIRAQPGRFLIHLINYSAYDVPVSGVKLTLHLPQSLITPAVFYPLDMSTAKCSILGDNLTITVRDFDVYELVAVQFEGALPHLKPEKTGDFILPVSSTGAAPIRGIAYIGRYPGTTVARDMRLPMREYPLTLLDMPIDYQNFSQKHCLLACSALALNRCHLTNLAAYVQAGGILHIFESTALYEDGNGNYRCDYDTRFDPPTHGTFFEMMTEACVSYMPRKYYLARARFLKHDEFAELPLIGEWFVPTAASRTMLDRAQLCTFFFNKINPEDVLVEADLYCYNDQNYTLSEKPFAVKPIVLLHRHGKGWVIWDQTVAAVTATGALHEHFSKLAQHILEWAIRQNE